MDNLLYEQIPGFRNLKQADFLAKFNEDVSDWSTEEIVEKVPYENGGDILVLGSGLAVLVSLSGKYSLFETEQRVEERRYFASWAEFCRGRWVEKCPTEPGVYACKDRDLGKRSFREIIRKDGRLVDVSPLSGGVVPPGRVSNFAGFWWLPAVPRLRDSY